METNHRPEFLEVGRILRPHGLKGELVVSFSSDRSERRVPGARFHVRRTNLSQTVAPSAQDREVAIRTIRPHQEKFLVVFDGVNSRPAADELAHSELWATPIDDPDELWVDEMIGATVWDRVTNSERGVVVGVLANPAADILELDSGALVPLTFVVGRTVGEGQSVRLEIEPPDGLFDL